MDSCEVDPLANVAATLQPSDLQNLRLVDKRFYTAVRIGRQALRPNRKMLTNALLVRLGMLFPSATSLDLTECKLLDNPGLIALPAHFSCLRSLNLSCQNGGGWLRAAGVGHLAGLPQLESLTLINCFGLEALPATISQMTLLQHLDMFSCVNLLSLPEELGGLTTLRTLDLGNCKRLKKLPESIGALSLLQTLQLEHCEALAEIPESISKLTGLKSILLRSNYALLTLPASIENLPGLTLLQVIDCTKLGALPESVGNLRALQKLLLAECKAITVLPAGLTKLASLKVLDLRWCYSLTAFPEGLRAAIPGLLIYLDGCPLRTFRPGGHFREGDRSSVVSQSFARMRSIGSVVSSPGHV